MKQQASPADHRIFGFTPEGQLRVSLFNGPSSHASRMLYTWIVGTEQQIAFRLASWYEQPLTEDEFTVLEELEQSNEASPYIAETDQPCDECGGTGRDPGSLNPFEPEDCPSCGGSGRETPMQSRRPAGRQTVNTARQGVA